MRTHVLATNTWEMVDVNHLSDPVFLVDNDVLTSNAPVDDMDKNAMLPAGLSIKLKGIKKLRVKGPIGTTVSIFS